MYISDLFDARKDDNLWNTSYPLSPSGWERFRVIGELPFGENALSFYIHIPFCRQLCSFCEYTRMRCPDKMMQMHYIDSLRNDLNAFLDTHPAVLLRGMDIGGGTPTALHDDAFGQLMDLFRFTVGHVQTSDDFEPSIETTFQTLSPRKLEMIADSGIRRISLGVQSTSTKTLQSYHRAGTSMKQMHACMDNIHAAGISKINLDLMYGLEKQTPESRKSDLDRILELRPEQVTLYEFRPNMVHAVGTCTKQELYEAYCQMYDGLTAMGYVARFGQNTFSRSASDYGVSSYLRSRMIDGVSYKGLGIAAQSMSNAGISYNVGKGSTDFSASLKEKGYPAAFTYLLPPAEIAAKYIAISAYYGSFSLGRVSELLQTDAMDFYARQIDFVLNEGLMQKDGDRLSITRKGFLYYGAVFSLFYKSL